MIIKYKVEVGFKDKYTGEKIKKDSVLDIDIKRMKELNAKRKGRVIDIIEDTDVSKSENEKTADSQKIEKEESSKVKYTEEELTEKTVNELKELAEKEGYELSKATKKDIIQEILELQK